MTSKGQITVPNDLRKALGISLETGCVSCRHRTVESGSRPREAPPHSSISLAPSVPRGRGALDLEKTIDEAITLAMEERDAKKPRRMIGLDTNVLLRLFVEDDPAQSDRARRFVDAAAADEPCLVNSVVLAEFAWTLAAKLTRRSGARSRV